jgi:hypothetical protein
MIHSSRRDRKTKAIAEVLAMVADAHPELAPHHPRPVRETDEWLRESATEFCAALELCRARYANEERESLNLFAARFASGETLPPAWAGENPGPLDHNSNLRLYRFPYNGRILSFQFRRNVCIRSRPPFLCPYIVDSRQSFCLRILRRLSSAFSLMTHCIPCVLASNGSGFSLQMCNLYSLTRSQEAMRRLFTCHARLDGQSSRPSGRLPGYDGAGCSCRSRWRARAHHDALGFSAAADWQCADHERAQSEVTLLARLAQGGMALSRAGHVILRMDG